jgi:hypothetical protein
MAKLKYKTQAVNTAIDPAGGYICRVINADPIEDDAVFQEVIDALRLTESVFGLKKAMEAVIETAMRKTATDGVPRKVGGLFRTYITIRGKVPNGDSPFVALTGRGAGAYVRWGLSSEVQREVDYNAVSISNVRGGQSISVGSIAYNGAEENAFDIRRGVPILVTGRNLAYIAGDLVTVSRTVDGADAVLATLTPEESDYFHQSFAWPSALDGVPVGSELKFTFRLRGGDETASPVTVAKSVHVGDGGDTPPTPLGEPTIDTFTSEGVAEENAVVLSGSNVSIFGDNLQHGGTVKVLDGNAQQTELATATGTWDAGNQCLNCRIETSAEPENFQGTLTVTTEGGTAIHSCRFVSGE